MLSNLSDRIRALEQARDWPGFSDLVDRLREPPLPAWACTVAACEACGGAAEAAEPAAAAVVCLGASIALVDDLLDDDPSAVVDAFGASRAANMAMALQAGSALLLENSSFSLAQREAGARWINRTAMATARGQDLDRGPCNDEGTYWRIVEAKSTPLLECALVLGAIAAGDVVSESGLAEIGRSIGKIVQVSDDLNDVMTGPAAMDWERPGHNLALLFATTADYADKDRFLELLPSVKDSAALEEAQLLLTRSGAVGFCVYQMVLLYRQAIASLDTLELPKPEVLSKLLEDHIGPVTAFLDESGVPEVRDALANR